MKRTRRHITTLILTVTIFCSSIILFPMEGIANQTSDDNPYINPISTTTYYLEPNGSSICGTNISIVNCEKASSIKDLKSTDTDVARVVARQGYLQVYSYKTGKATITCTVGDTELSTTINVLAYENPVKSFKIGSTDYKKQYNETSDYDWYYTKECTENLTIKAASGWTITSMEGSINNQVISETNLDTTRYKMKAQTFCQETDSITVTFYHEADDMYQSIVFHAHKE